MKTLSLQHVSLKVLLVALLTGLPVFSPGKQPSNSQGLPFLPASGFAGIESSSRFPTIRTVDEGLGYIRAVEAVDIDDDGDNDIVGADFFDGIGWWENTDGQGLIWTSHEIDDGFMGYSIGAADIDGDNDIDVVSVSINQDIVAWWENLSGDGSDWARHSIDTDYQGAISVCLADFDNDSDIDVLAGALTGWEVAWWENVSTDGTEWTKHSLSKNFYAYHVNGKDIDADGDVDVIAGGSSGLTLWENIGGPGSSWQTHVLDADAAYAHASYPKDMDADGDLDVALILNPSDSALGVIWLENPGTSAYPWQRHVVDSDFDGGRDLTGADLDADGDPDLIGAAGVDGTGIVWWERITTDGLTWSRHDLPGSSSGGISVRAVDISGDGVLDILGAHHTESDGAVNNIVWWENGAGYPKAVVTPDNGTTIVTSNMDIDVAFSETVYGVDNTDIELGGTAAISAAVGAVVDLGSNTWRFPISGLQNGQLVVHIAQDPGDIEDSDGNGLFPCPPIWSYPVLIDTTPPYVSAVSPPSEATLGTASLFIDVIFSEPVTGVDVTDMSLSGDASTNASLESATSIDDVTWRFHVDGLTPGDLSVALVSSQNDIEDAAGHDLNPDSWVWHYEVHAYLFAFLDRFTSTTFSADKWSTVTGAMIDSVGIDEPSPPYAARLNGLPHPMGGGLADSIESVSMDLASAPAAVFVYSSQKGGGGTAPMEDDDLVITYQDASGAWHSLTGRDGGGTDSQFVQKHVRLPSDALHETFRLMLTTTGHYTPPEPPFFIPPAGYTTYGDWFVDDIEVYVDTTSPTVVAVSPSPGSAVSDGILNIDVTFSEPIDEDSMWSAADHMEISGPAVTDDYVPPPTRIGETTWRFSLSDLFVGELQVSLGGDPEFPIEDYAGRPLTPSPVNWSYTVEFPPSLAAPFIETYPTQSLDADRWRSFDGLEVVDMGTSAPSPPYCSLLSGGNMGFCPVPCAGDFLESRYLDLSGMTNTRLMYSYLRASSSGSGDDLVADCRTTAGVWMEIGRQLGTGPAMDHFAVASVSIPPDGCHENSQVRFRRTGHTQFPSLFTTFGDYYVDDIEISGDEIPSATGSIVVTVSLLEELSVAVAPDAWSLGEVALGEQSGATSFTATVGNVATDLEIRATDGAGGWSLGSPPAENVFEVAVDSPAMTLTTSDQPLASSIPPYGETVFGLTYTAPSADTFTARVDQSFQVLLKASIAP